MIRSEKRQPLRELLSSALESACDLTAYPRDLRAPLLNKLIDALLIHDLEVDVPWTEKLNEVAIRRPIRSSLPAQAPALWVKDKQRGDNPPEFIKRHYGKWLRDDATGLTRADLRRLDRSLYVSINNWSRRNEWPADCPLPDIHQRVEAELSGKALDPEKIGFRDFKRLANAYRKRKTSTDSSYGRS